MIIRGKLIRIVFALFVFGGGAIGCEASGTLSSESVQVCYIEFSAMTYAAIDRNNFSKKCTDLGDMKLADGPMKELFEVIGKGRATDTFDDTIVRLSVRMADKSFVYVNQGGEVIHDGKIVKISAKDVRKLDEKLFKIQQSVFKK